MVDRKTMPCHQRAVSPEHVERLSYEECEHMLARLSKGIAHPVRIRIVTILAHKPDGNRCICGDIVNALPLAQSSVSQHLKMLKETGWIHGEIEGPRVCYCLVDGIADYYQTLFNRVMKSGIDKA